MASSYQLLHPFFKRPLQFLQPEVGVSAELMDIGTLRLAVG